MRKMLLASALLMFSTGSFAANVVSFDPTVVDGVMVGDTFSMNIIGSTFDVPVDGGGLNIDYDMNVVNITGITVDGLQWNFFSDPGVIDNGTGRVSDLLFNQFSDGSPEGDFFVATVDFEAVGAGSSNLFFSESTLNPWTSGLGGIDILYVDGVVNVVPEMEVWAMMIAGMGILGWKARRSQQRKEEDGLLAA